MSNAKHGLRALGLCLLAALGLMAFAAAGAQAEWLVEKVAIKEHIDFNGVIHPLKPEGKEKHAVLLVKDLNLEILCEELVVLDGLLFPNTVEGLAHLEYKKCKTFVSGAEKAGCKPKEPILALVLFRLFLHEVEGKKLTYLLFEPDNKAVNFTIIEFNEETCALPSINEIHGTVVAECLNEKLEDKKLTGLDSCLEELVHHLIQEALEAEKLFPKDGLFYGEHVALLDGITDIFLINLPGQNVEGKKWSGHV